MTDPTDKPRFNAAFGVLAVATRLSVAEIDPTMKRIYFDGLKELSIDAVEAGAQFLAHSSDWFPKVAEWKRASIVQRRHADLRALLPAKTQTRGPWRHECQTCEDSGWEVVLCEAGARCRRRICAKYDDAAAEAYALVKAAAEREQREIRAEELPAPYTHRYAIRCFCIATNSTYKRQWHAQFGNNPESEVA